MADLLYVGFKGGVEDLAVPAENIRLLSLPMASPDSVARTVRFGFDLIAATVRCVARFRRFKPDVLFSTGGFVSLPSAIAATLLRVPVVVYLPDVLPGKSVRLTRRLARRMAVTVEETVPMLGAGFHAEVTGYPVRPAFLTTDRAASRSQFGLSDDELQVLVMGGSQGAVAINSAVIRLLPELLAMARVIHVCGPRNLDDVRAATSSLSSELSSRYTLVPTLSGDEVARAMFASDVGVLRAGASILGELPMAGLPSLLVPLPINAQDLNAAALASRGAALLIPQTSDWTARLRDGLLSLLDDASQRDQMRQALFELRRPDAADRIADLIAEQARRAA